MIPTQRVPGTHHPALTSAIHNAACVDAAQHTYCELARLGTLTADERDAYDESFWLASSAWARANHTKSEQSR